MDTLTNRRMQTSTTALLITLLAGCVAGIGSRNRAQNAELRIVSFGSVNGEIGSNQGHSGDKGGLPRRVGYIESLRARGTPLLHLDLGNLSTGPRDGGENTTTVLWEEMERMGVDATTPGVNELTLWHRVGPLYESGSIPIVSSNLWIRTVGEWERVGVPYHRVNVNGVSVALFGLIEKHEAEMAPTPDGIEFRCDDPVRCAAELVPRLRRMADVVVLMSQLSTQETDDLLTQVPGIDVALYGNRATWAEDSPLVGRTITSQTGIRGQYMADLCLILDPDGRIVDFGSRNAPLTKEFPVDPATDARVNVILDRERAARMAKRSAELAATRAWVARTTPEEGYVGSQACRRCHEQEYQHWLTTPHARATQPLRDLKKARDEACAGCHVTAWGVARLLRWSNGDHPLDGVQCESCHGPGGTHAREGSGTVPESTCRGCHRCEWERGFSYEALLPLVRHR